MKKVLNKSPATLKINYNPKKENMPIDHILRKLWKYISHTNYEITPINIVDIPTYRQEKSFFLTMGSTCYMKLSNRTSFRYNFPTVRIVSAVSEVISLHFTLKIYLLTQTRGSMKLRKYPLLTHKQRITLG